jgi:hypothetical protein
LKSRYEHAQQKHKFLMHIALRLSKESIIRRHYLSSETCRSSAASYKASQSPTMSSLLSKASAISVRALTTSTSFSENINETKATNALRIIALARTFRLTQRIRYVEQNIVHPSGTDYSLPGM